jgi:hypothetical protein
MSTIANFIKLPVRAIDQLQSNYDATIDQFGQSVASYEWSGYVLATLLPYLREQGIDLMKSPYNELTKQLSKDHRASIFILPHAHQEAFFDKLSPSHFSSAELRDYYNEFNESDEEEIGQAMLDGIAALQCSLGTLDADSVVLLSIG